MHFEKIENFESLLFALLLLFLPVNLAKHFFFDFAYVEGILVDYLIPTVYLTDILIWGLLGFWLFRVFRNLSPVSSGSKTINSSTVRTVELFLLALILISGLSVFRALNQPAAIYRWLKLFEYTLFSFYISKNIDLKKDWSTIVKLLSVGVLFESVLAIAQWFKQGSVFGYWFFGENKYTVSTPGIAILDFAGIRKARPYGTFPHPNVLGGYLAVVLPWILYIGMKGVKGIKDRRFHLLILILGLVAVFLSFSRSAWVVGVLGLLGVLGLTLRTDFHFNSSLVLFNPIPILLNSLSFLRRAELNWIALEIIKDHPLLGVGLNNFTVAMNKYGQVSGWTRFLQPVHNVYLLLAAEIGLVGLSLFLCLLFSSFKILASSFRASKFHRLLLISLTQVVLLSFVDHYFWTLQQTSLLFWLVLGLVFSAVDRKIST